MYIHKLITFFGDRINSGVPQRISLAALRHPGWWNQHHPWSPPCTLNLSSQGYELEPGLHRRRKWQEYPVRRIPSEQPLHNQDPIFHSCSILKWGKTCKFIQTGHYIVGGRICFTKNLLSKWKKNLQFRKLRCNLKKEHTNGFVGIKIALSYKNLFKFSLNHCAPTAVIKFLIFAN